jgi:hypothetical protein
LLDFDDVVLLVAGTGIQFSGWFCGIDNLTGDATIEHFDTLNSCGLALADGRLYRILSTASEADAVGELLSYDEAGVTLYRRIDGLCDPHGLAWDGSVFHVPCSAANEIVRVAPTGEILGRWRAPGEHDAWHVNAVHIKDGRAYASAFGRFKHYREWAEHFDDATGIIFNVESGDTIISGLSCPHDPFVLDGRWAVCDSRTHRVLAFDENGRIERSVDLGGWTRGVAVGRDHLFIGISGQRHADEIGAASIVVLDRHTWREVNRIPLQSGEVTSLALVPRALLGALRRGFRTNAARTAAQDREEMFRLVGNIHPEAMVTPMAPLDAEQSKITVEASVPESVGPDRDITVSLAITNHSEHVYISALPHPILIAYSWRPAGSNQAIGEMDARRAPLPQPLAPGRTLECAITVRTPEEPGEYALCVTLVQEWIRWFDGIDPTHAAVIPVTITDRVRISAL